MRVAPPSVGAQQEAACRTLEHALPHRLGHLDRRPATPAPTLTAAWGDPPVVLRCGVGLPSGFNAGSSVVGVDDVSWYQQVLGSRVRWTTVDRTTQVEVTVPTSYAEQGALLVDLAGPIKQALRQQARQPPG